MARGGKSVSGDGTGGGGGGGGGKKKPSTSPDSSSLYSSSYILAVTDPGSVTIVGSSGDDIIAGVPLDANPFDKTIFTDSDKQDILSGGNSDDSVTVSYDNTGDGADTFVLGNSQGVYYANYGDTDFATITDFNVDQDRIQIYAAATLLAYYDPNYDWGINVNGDPANETGALLLYYVADGSLDLGLLDADLIAVVLSETELSAFDITWVDDTGEVITAEPPVDDFTFDDTVYGDGSTTGTSLGPTLGDDTVYGFVNWNGSGYDDATEAEYALAQIDYLNGGAGADIYKFADPDLSRVNYYTSHGFEDYAVIDGFDVTEDKIQIWDSADVVITAEHDLYDPTKLYLYWQDTSVDGSLPDLFAVVHGTTEFSARDIQWLDQNDNPIQPANNDNVYGDGSTDGATLGATTGPDILHGLVDWDGSAYVENFDEYGQIQVDYVNGGAAADVYVFGDTSGVREMYYTDHGALDYMIIDDFNVAEDIIRIYDTPDTVITATWNSERGALELYHNIAGSAELDKFAEIVPEDGLEFSASSINFQAQDGSPIGPTESDYSDTVIGGANGDVLNGIYNSDGDSPQFNEEERVAAVQVDTLTGLGGADTFVLGDASGQYYTNGGDNDFARITDYNPQTDSIQIYDDPNVGIGYAQINGKILLYDITYDPFWYAYFDILVELDRDLIAEITFSSGNASINSINWVNQNGVEIAPS